MARFYASILGSRGEATRMGTPQSGMYGHIRGWNVGGSVECHARDDARNQHDTVSLLLTGGSNGQRNSGVEIAAFEEEGPRVRYLVRLPGGLEVHGYVGDARVTVIDARDHSDSTEGKVLWTNRPESDQ